jgi:hypothetical protein
MVLNPRQPRSGATQSGAHPTLEGHVLDAKIGVELIAGVKPYQNRLFVLFDSHFHSAFGSLEQVF